MKSSKDYSIFRDYASNREIDKNHLNRLIRSIARKNLLHVNPIVVDEKMHVIDGQHRLEAARSLGLEIYYIVGEVGRQDISMLNSNQKNWKIMDYINYWTVEKKHSYVLLSNLINHYPNMSLSALVSLADSEGRRNTNAIREGNLDVLEIERARKICEICEKLFKDFSASFVFDSRFPLAFARALTAEGFKTERFFEEIASAPRSFVPCHTIEQYIEMIEEIYNRGLSKNRIRIE